MSERATHTPGPWTIRVFDPWDKDIRIDPCGVTVDHDDVDQLEAQATARLIAAAPDLYAAAEPLAEIIASFTGEGNVPFSVFADELRALLAACRKARGEQP